MPRSRKDKTFHIKTGKARNARKGERSHHVSTLHEEEYEEEWVPWWVASGRFLIAILLLFPCVAVTLLVIQQFHQGGIVGELTGNQLSVRFLCGGALCIFMHLFKKGRQALLPVYVLGHEVTHALFVFLCYGTVSDFNASHRGGYIIANRSNLLVSLSPYIFPFWSLVVTLGFFLASLFINISPFLSYFYVLLGASWVFNLLWTLMMIPLGQSDLKDNGTFFSLNVIYLCNITLLSLLMELGSSSPEIASWFYALINTHIELFLQLQEISF